jgi:3-deoxy-manno-octulosonate cytidylyltransferase (CMP-KDO synthetase)
MRLLCVIPARIGSTRLREKPLRLLGGAPLIYQVAKRVLELDVGGELVVATDDCRVADAVRPLGVDAILTSPKHASGTERVAEVVQLPRFAPIDVVLNIQGDEPFISGEAVIGALARVDAGDDVGTAAAPMVVADAGDRDRVKVVVGPAGRALRFTRGLDRTTGFGGQRMFQHLGVYAYTRTALARWVRAQPVPEEIAERLEQLRALALGLAVGVAVVEQPPGPSIDTEADLVEAEHHLGVMSRR